MRSVLWYPKAGAGWRPPEPRDRGARYLFFTNECVGLGHLRRCLALAEAVRALDPAGSVLIVTGSQALPQEPPQGVDLVKLPALGRDEQGSVGARSLDVPHGRITEVRAQVALATATAFDPDVVVIDKLPLGLAGELLPTLEALRRSGRARVVLGLRDIEDDPARVRRSWAARGLRDAVSRYYDEVLVYGPDAGQDALACVGWSATQPPVRHVGYVGTPLPPAAAGLPPQYLLVTSGGGVDGHALSAAVLDAVRLRPLGLPVVLVAGPLMPADLVASLRDQARGLDVTVLVSRPDLDAVIVGARAAVTMAGYNTVSELLRSGTPALLVPRVQPSSEQLIRATRLADAGLVHLMHPDRLTPSTVREALDDLLAVPRHAGAAEGYDGAAQGAAALVRLAALAADDDEPAAARAAR